MAVIVGFTGDNPLLQGTTDADEIFGNSSGTLNGIGGNDRIFGLAGEDAIAGDAHVIGPNGRGGNDVIHGGADGDSIWGDAREALYGIGGNDTIYQNAGNGRLYGDSEGIETGGRGGNDRIFGGSTITGDSASSITSVIGGNDLLDASSVAVTARLYGETFDFMRGTSVGGRDTLKGGTSSDSLFGDAGGTLEDASRGGNDSLSAAGGDDDLQGDGLAMEDTSTGGDDVLRGGAGEDSLYGDARRLEDFAQGGDDALHSGGGDDEIWGDGELRDDAQGGRDRFHFNVGFGDDRVLDFRQEDGDQLVFKGLNQTEIQISAISALDPDDNPVDSTLITTLGDESVTLVGFTGSLTVGTDLVFV